MSQCLVLPPHPFITKEEQARNSIGFILGALRGGITFSQNVKLLSQVKIVRQKNPLLFQHPLMTLPQSLKIATVARSG